MAVFEKLDGTTQAALHIGGPVGPSVNQSADGQNAVEHRSADGTSLTAVRGADPVLDSDLVTLRVLTAALLEAGLPPPKTPTSRWYADGGLWAGNDTKGLYG